MLYVFENEKAYTNVFISGFAIPNIFNHIVWKIKWGKQTQYFSPFYPLKIPIVPICLREVFNKRLVGCWWKNDVKVQKEEGKKSKKIKKRVCEIYPSA